MKLYAWDAGGVGAGVTKSTLNTTSSLNNQIDGRASVRNSFFGMINTGGAGDTSASFQYDVVGINVAKIPNMQTAIDTYIKSINEYLNGIDALANANSAFKSEEVQAAVRNYIEKVKEYSKNLISQLSAFDDKLSDVRQAYEANVGTLADLINENANNNFGEGSFYTPGRAGTPVE